MKNKQDDFSVFQRKIAVRFFGSALLSVGIVIALYLFLWKERFGDWIVAILEYVGRMEHEEAFLIYLTISEDIKKYSLLWPSLWFF